MSAIAALFAPDGSPDTLREINSIVDSMSERGPDHSGVWLNEWAALGHACLITHPEDRERQPLEHAESGSVLVFDGHLDAREELAASIGVDRRRLGGMSDAALVLHGYAERGVDVFGSLLGDFAFALWDQPRQQLLCARDLFGLRPLFYSHDGDELVVASELQAVLRGRPGRPNIGMVAEALSGGVATRDETLFAGVRKLLPGSLLVATRSRVQLTPYARFVAPPPLDYAREEEYYEHFRDVLGQAVRDRLRKTGRAAVMLSGGVDSSTVYAAARCIEDLDAYTVEYEDPQYDETAVARAVVARNGGRLHCVGLAAATYDYADDICRFRDLPTYPPGANSTALRRQSAAEGVRVLLSGVGGDEWFFGNAGRWTDWFRTGRWWLLCRELRTWRYSADPTSWRDLAMMTVHPLIPQGARRIARALRRNYAPYPWVTPSLVRETSLLDRLRQRPDVSGPTHAISGMLRGVLHGGALAAWEDQERLAARHGQDERMPYFDRRVIQFALAIPETLRSRPGCPKYITRRAWADCLPPEVLSPPEPADYTFHIVNALKAQGGSERLDDLVIADLGWVDRNVIRDLGRRLFRTAPSSREYIRYAWPLWSVLAVDQWYRHGLPAPRTFPAPEPIASLPAFR